MEEMDALTESEFQQMFRVTRERFDSVLATITPDISKNEEMGRRSAGTPITPKTKLAVTLRWLAGGSHHDLRFAWGISKGSFYADTGVLWPTIYAIDRHYDLEF